MSLLRSLFLILGVQVLVTASVIFVFRTVEARIIAALIAATLFSLMGLLIVLFGVRQKDFRRMLTFWVGLIHLLVASLPMLVTRALSMSAEFSEVKVWGIPGPVFHRIAEGLSLALLVCTIIDLVRVARRNGQQKSLP